MMFCALRFPCLFNVLIVYCLSVYCASYQFCMFIMKMHSYNYALYCEVSENLELVYIIAY